MSKSGVVPISQALFNGLNFYDEDDMSSNDAKGVASQQSIKAYIDNVAGDAKKYVRGTIADVSTAGSSWAISPIAGTISKIYTVIDGTIATADAGLSFEIGGVAVTDGGITIAYDGSAAGDADSATPSAANVVTAGGAIEMITDGASTNSVSASVLFEITPA